MQICFLGGGGGGPGPAELLENDLGTIIKFFKKFKKN